MAGPTPDNGLRRSKRTRVQPLAWYRSERVSYRWDREAQGNYYTLVVTCSSSRSLGVQFSLLLFKLQLIIHSFISLLQQMSKRIRRYI